MGNVLQSLGPRSASSWHDPGGTEAPSNVYRLDGNRRHAYTPCPTRTPENPLAEQRRACREPPRPQINAFWNVTPHAFTKPRWSTGSRPASVLGLTAARTSATRASRKALLCFLRSLSALSVHVWCLPQACHCPLVHITCSRAWHLPTRTIVPRVMNAFNANRCLDHDGAAKTLAAWSCTTLGCGHSLCGACAVTLVLEQLPDCPLCGF